jgi:hypothetical protein
VDTRRTVNPVFQVPKRYNFAVKCPVLTQLRSQSSAGLRRNPRLRFVTKKFSGNGDINSLNYKS